MHSRTLLARVERAEQLAETKTKFSADCICWPENELPFFGFEIEREIAAQVECPVHGETQFLAGLPPLHPKVVSREGTRTALAPDSAVSEGMERKFPDWVMASRRGGNCERRNLPQA